MLKTRLLTAAVLIPLVVLAVLKLQTTVLTGFLALVVFLAALEWLGLMGKFSMASKLVVASLLTICSLFSVYSTATSIMMLIGALTWFAALVLVSVYAHRPLPNALAKLLHHSSVNVVIAAIVFSIFTYSSIYIHQSQYSGPSLLLFVMVTVWLADTGGYFAGKRLGKRKLAVAISPNKTWEGVAGALVLSTLWATSFYYLLDSVQLSFCSWLAVNLLTVLFSIVGDLFESVFKRNFSIKDSGNLLPGHGGVLDRIDSLLAAVPTFAIIMMLLGAL